MHRATLPIGSAATLAVALALASPAARAGVRGDMGWSADGSAYGLCDAWILPDSETGCRFYSRKDRVWIEVGRREALELWRPWDPQLHPSGTRQILPVYPLGKDEDNPGPVVLEGRLVPSDEVVELWRLSGDVLHGERGGEWTTVFEWSTDGLWLAAGAVHVDHETSRNEYFVTVRPVTEWLALAHERLARRDLHKGRIKAGVKHLSRAALLLTVEGRDSIAAAPPEPRGSPIPLGTGIDDVLRMGWVRWSRDGSKLCACDSWQQGQAPGKARCRVMVAPWQEWKPVLVSLVHTHCPGYGKPPPAPPEQIPYRFFADGGFDGERGAIAVYVTGGDLGSKLGAVIEKQWDEPLASRAAYPSYFVEVAEPGPDSKLVALGWAADGKVGAWEADGDEQGSSLTSFVQVRPLAGWVEIALAEAALHARTDPTTLEDARPAITLPVEIENPGKPPSGEVGQPVPGKGGCSLAPVPM